MSELSPVQIAVLACGLVSVIGIVVNALKEKRIFVGYQDIVSDVKRLAASLHNAKIFPDGDDLVVSGNHQQTPVVIRFSHSETAADLRINVGAPVSFSLSLSPKAGPGSGGQVVP